MEIVGFGESGVMDGAGNTTHFVVGKCTDVLLRVTTAPDANSAQAAFVPLLPTGGKKGLVSSRRRPKEKKVRGPKTKPVELEN